MVNSWGYDQTNVNFYEVKKLVGTSSVEIQPIASKTVRSETGSDYVKPAKGDFYDKSAKVRFNGNSVKIPSSMDGYGHASIWDGRERRETAAGYGH